jgi:2,3-bisphosphoglycerate-independent phosphoglycerate mutase
MDRTHRKYKTAGTPHTLPLGVLHKTHKSHAARGKGNGLVAKHPNAYAAPSPHNKTVLAIVDGFGRSERKSGNAVLAADMRNFNDAFASFPSCYIRASGREVGLDSDKDAGNSEVGHNAIGAGQIIKQGLSLLNDKYATGEIFATEVWNKLSQTAKAAKLDIIILLSDGRVHSDITHLFRVLEQCKAEGITARIFAIADGRDVPPQSIKNYIAQTDEFIARIGVNAKISVVGGRGQFFMDRYEAQTELLSRAVSVCADGGGIPTADIFASVNEFYRANPAATDEQLPPFVLCAAEQPPKPISCNAVLPSQVLHGTHKNPAARGKENGAAAKSCECTADARTHPDRNPTVPAADCAPNPADLIRNGDAVLLLNYRGDRAIETARMFDTGAYITPEQYGKIKDCLFVGALQYDAEKELPKNFLCPPPHIENTLTQWLSAHGIRQYTVTETVKFGHLTYFFNGNRTDPFDAELETAVEIESDKLNNQYDRAPKMKAAEIADKLIFNIRHGDYTFFKCNFPNPDMVGHTGVLSAVITACQCVDKQLGRLIEVCKTDRVNLIITADHGNAEEMTDENGKTKTAHTNNPVPFIVCPFTSGTAEIKGGGFGLTNIAATVCDLIGVGKNPVWRESIIK